MGPGRGAVWLPSLRVLPEVLDLGGARCPDFFPALLKRILFPARALRVAAAGGFAVSFRGGGRHRGLFHQVRVASRRAATARACIRSFELRDDLAQGLVVPLFLVEPAFKQGREDLLGRPAGVFRVSEDRLDLADFFRDLPYVGRHRPQRLEFLHLEFVSRLAVHSFASLCS